MRIFTSWGWLVGDGEEKCKVWGAGSVCARAGAFGGGSMSDYHESVSEKPGNLWLWSFFHVHSSCHVESRAALQGKCVGLFPKPAGECQHRELLGKHKEWKHL